MGGEDRRRSKRHLLGAPCVVHVGPITIDATVHDISRHGMGLTFPDQIPVNVGDTVWILVSNVASYAITATVRRVNPEGRIGVGVEFHEILAGPALETIESLPLA